MGQLEKRKAVILNTLLEREDYVTAQQLATLTGVSVRTVKSDIAALNQLIGPCQVQIHSVPNRGYKLELGDDTDLSQLALLMDDSELRQFYKVPQDSNERVYYLIRKLLVVDYSLDAGELADEIYVSEPTVIRDLQKARVIFAKRNLKLVMEKKGNVRLEGSELNKRLAISEFFFHNEKHAGKEENMFRDGLNRQEVEGIRIILRLVCKEFGIVLSDASLSNLVIHVFIALTRYRFYNFIEADDVLREEYREAVEYAAAKRLTEALEEAYDFVIPDDEVIYYAMHLRVKRIYDEIPLTDQERVRINHCISECFWEIFEEYGIDFSQDLELRHYLYQHIPLMIVRLKNHMSFRYPQVSEKPSSYLFSIKLTYILSGMIERFYQVKVNAQEFEYLVIYFCFALCKNRTGKKIRIGVYNGGGRAETVMYFNAVRNAFHEDDFDVRIVDYGDLFQLDSGTVDICVSTCNLEEVPVMETVIIKDQSYISEIRRAIYRYKSRRLDWERYFKPWCILSCLKGREPEQILKNLRAELIKRGIFTDGTLEELRFECMEIGNGVVFVNLSGCLCRDGFFLMGVLERPMIWDMEVARIILMADTVRHSDPDLPELCYVLSKWMNSCGTEEIMEKQWDYQEWMCFLRQPMED